MQFPARFMVLFGGADDKPRDTSGAVRAAGAVDFRVGRAGLRAVLFDSEQRWIGEVIEEDGFIVDSLLRSARECPMPRADMLMVLAAPPSPQQSLRCFDLG